MKVAISKERHARPSLLSDFILGCQDGLVNVLGILLGTTAATTDVRLIYVAAFAALAAESISMGAVAYTSTLARRKQYLKELEREEEEMKNVPHLERDEVKDIFRRWGYSGDDLERATEIIVKNPRAWLELMMSNELYLQPVDETEPRRSFFVVLASAVVGSLVPLLPYLVLRGSLFTDAVGSVALSGAMLFVIGYFEARTTVGSLWKSGSQMAVIGLAAGLAGFIIGHLIGSPPG